MVSRWDGWFDKRRRKEVLDYDRKVMEVIDDFSRKIRAKRILDVGCGTGFPYGAYFLEKGYEVYGVDIVESAIQELKEAYPQIKAYVADARKLPFEDSAFDIVYCFQSLWYVPGVEKALDEMIRVVKPTGYIFFDIINGAHPKRRRLYWQERVLGPCYRAILILFPPVRHIFNAIFRMESTYRGGWAHIFACNKPIHPSKLYRYFQEKDIGFAVLPQPELQAGVEFRKTPNIHKEEDRLVFQLKKKS